MMARRIVASVHPVQEGPGLYSIPLHVVAGISDSHYATLYTQVAAWRQAFLHRASPVVQASSNEDVEFGRNIPRARASLINSSKGQGFWVRGPLMGMDNGPDDRNRSMEYLISAEEDAVRHAE